MPASSKERSPRASRSPAAAAAWPPIGVDHGIAYELPLAILAASEARLTDSYDDGRRLREGAEAADRRLIRDTTRFSRGCGGVWLHVLGLAAGSARPRDVPALRAAVERLDPEVFRLRLLGFGSARVERALGRQRVAAARTGDAAARRAIARGVCPLDSPCPSVARFLDADAATLRAELLALLERWHDAVRGTLDGWAPILARDADATRRRLASEPGAAVFEQATNGIVLVPEPDIRSVTLVPSMAIRPSNVRAVVDGTSVVAYAVAAESIGATGDDPPERLVRLSKALGDERRLRVLRHLTTGDFTLQELAERFEAPKTTMLHHLVILRAAGLVRGTSGRGAYTLSEDAFDDLGDLLRAYLRRRA